MSAASDRTQLVEFDVAIVGYGPVGQAPAALLGGPATGWWRSSASRRSTGCRAAHLDHEIAASRTPTTARRFGVSARAIPTSPIPPAPLVTYSRNEGVMLRTPIARERRARGARQAMDDGRARSPRLSRRHKPRRSPGPKSRPCSAMALHKPGPAAVALPVWTSTSTDAALLLPGEAGGPPTSSRVASVSSEWAIHLGQVGACSLGFVSTGR